MKVSEHFDAANITEEELEELEVRSSYWHSAVTFVFDKWNTEISTLSHKQAAWVKKIADDINGEKAEMEEKGIK